MRASVTDAEGVNTLREGVLPVLLALIIGRIITRPKPIAVTVNADKPSPQERARRLASLASRSYQVEIRDRLAAKSGDYSAAIEPGQETPLLVAVSGIPGKPRTPDLKKHAIEYHIACLKPLGGYITPEETTDTEKP